MQVKISMLPVARALHFGYQIWRVFFPFQISLKSFTVETENKNSRKELQYGFHIEHAEDICYVYFVNRSLFVTHLRNRCEKHCDIVLSVFLSVLLTTRFDNKTMFFY